MNGLAWTASALASAMASAAATPAYAADQVQPATAQRTPGVSPPQGANPGDATRANDEIVVTAMRTQSLASKTPLALSAISGDSLRSTGITNPASLGDQLPNLSIVRGNGLQITIRGVTSTDGTEKGDPSAAFLLDGIYIARPQAQEVSFFDLDRVEVLRGPQGTLYGRNTTAGVVNVISARPQHDFVASLDASYGNFDSRQLTGVINVPVGSAVAIRGALNYDRRDSYLYKGFAAGTLDPFKNNLSGRLSALFDLGNVDLVVRGDYSKLKGVPVTTVRLSNFYVLPTAAGTDPARRSDLSKHQQRTDDTPESAQNRQDDDTWGVQAELNWRTSLGTLTYLGSYRDFDRNDVGNTYVGGPVSFRNTFVGSYWQTSHELRFAIETGGLKSQFGGYYFREQSSIALMIQGFQGACTPVAVVGCYFGFPQDPTIAQSYAGFGQATYSLTDALRLTAGARYSHDLKSRVGQTVFQVGPAFNPATDHGGINNARATFSKTTWRVGLDYDLNERTLLYASVATGYKAGGFNDGCEIGVAGCNNPIIPGDPAANRDALYYEPETLTAYEAGLKTRTANGAVRLNAGIFHYDYKGLQLSQIASFGGTGAPVNVTTNAGKAKVDGVELEAVVAPSRHDRFDLQADYLDARYSEFAPQPGVSWKGKKLDRSPKWVAAAGYTHTFDLNEHGRLLASGRVRYSDSFVFASISTLQQLRQPGYTTVDLTLTYSAPGDRWYIQAFGKNLTDALYLTGASTSFAGSATVGDPRTYGLRAGIKF